MISYKGKSFCSAKCGKHDCSNKFTQGDELAAKRWWGSDDAPVAFTDESTHCTDHVPVKTKE